MTASGGGGGTAVGSGRAVRRAITPAGGGPGSAAMATGSVGRLGGLATVVAGLPGRVAFAPPAGIPVAGRVAAVAVFLPRPPDGAVLVRRGVAARISGVAAGSMTVAFVLPRGAPGPADFVVAATSDFAVAATSGFIFAVAFGFIFAGFAAFLSVV